MRVSEITCEVCRRGLTTGVNHLHRQNEKGVLGVWRCEDCNTKVVSKEVKHIFDVLDGKVTR